MTAAAPSGPPVDPRIKPLALRFGGFAASVVLPHLDAADRAAGVVRVDTTSDATFERMRAAAADVAPGYLLDDVLRAALAALREDCLACGHNIDEHLAAWCRALVDPDHVCGCSAVTSRTSPDYGKIRFTNH